jgi:hypothetical protein
VKTPHVTLQQETSTPGVYADVQRKSGRIVEDQELVLAYTPEPLQRTGPQTHVWVAEWQAVPWMGAATDALDARGGLPLGNYRFHVEGSSWSLDSTPFAIVTGGLDPTATRASGSVHVVARWSAPKGWRLMDMVLMSNQPVPVRSQPVKLELLTAGNAVLGISNTMTDATGNATMADNVTAMQIRITDQFGNSQTLPLP